MPLSPCPHIKQSYSYFPTYLVVQVEFFFSFSPWFLVLELLTAMYIFPALLPPPAPPCFCCCCIYRREQCSKNTFRSRVPLLLSFA